MKHASPKSATRIDWEAVRKRLALSQLALTEVEQLSVEQAKAVMDKRADLLARVPETAPDTSEVLEVMTFRLGDEAIAIATCFVHEVIRPNQMTPLPGSDDFHVGLTNLRGEVLSVVDLRQFLGVVDAPPGDNAQILVLGKESVQFGVLADAVDEVQILRIDQILEPPGSVAGVSREYLRGVTSEAMLVLDGEVLLQDERLFIDESD